MVLFGGRGVGCCWSDRAARICCFWVSGGGNLILVMGILASVVNFSLGDGHGVGVVFVRAEGEAWVMVTMESLEYIVGIGGDFRESNFLWDGGRHSSESGGVKGII